MSYKATYTSFTPSFSEWMENQYGPMTYDFSGRWYIMGWEVYFREEQDYLLFVLKWGSK